MRCWTVGETSIVLLTGHWSPHFLESQKPLYDVEKNPFMVFPASPKTAEEKTPQRICSYINSPALQTTMALTVQVMRFSINIWISDLLVNISNEEKAKCCVHVHHCIPLSSMILTWNSWFSFYVYLIVPLRYRNVCIWPMQIFFPHYRNCCFTAVPIFTF